MESDDRRALLSDGWHKYFGFRIPPERIVCDGCTAPGQPRLVDTGCPVRPCVLARGLEHCGKCPDYVCDKLKERLVNRKEIEERMGETMPEEDYRLFIMPYESRGRFAGR